MSGSGASGLRFELATPDDEPALRRVLRENPMPGAVSVAFAREPDFHHAAGVEGPVHQALVARDPDGRVVGLATRSVRQAWVNGEARPLGYLSALRLDRAWRGRRSVLPRGFAALRALHDADGLTPFYATTIIADNQPARRILGANLPGMPRYTEREGICTLALATHMGRRARCDAELGPGRQEDIPELAAMLQRNMSRFQLAPVWTAEDLSSPVRCRGLRPEDFTVAWRGGGVVGAVACWDQQSFKQSIVTEYTPALAAFRGVVNTLGPVFNLPSLPPAGEALRHAFLSHLAVDGDDPELALGLVAEAHRRALGRGYAYLMLGLAERNPWKERIRKKFGAMEYRSVLYLVSWPEGHAAVDAVDGRVPHLEVAVL